MVLTLGVLFCARELYQSPLSHCVEHKNICAGALRFVNRMLMRRDDIMRRDMVDVVMNISDTNKAMLSYHVNWAGWKGFLRNFYLLSPSVRIKNYDLFKCSANDK